MRRQRSDLRYHAIASLAIRGAGGHGRDIADIAKACGFNVSFVDDDPSRGQKPNPFHSYFIGIADPKSRAAVDNGMSGGLAVGALVHPSVVGSIVDRNAGSVPSYAGAVIGAGTTLGPNVILGSHTHVGAGCTLTRTTIGDYCQIAPGVDIAGDVTIGDRVFVGVGATIANLVTIGDDAVVGAGAVVLHDVPAGATVAGVPAKVIKRRVAA